MPHVLKRSRPSQESVLNDIEGSPMVGFVRIEALSSVEGRWVFDAQEGRRPTGITVSDISVKHDRR